jgi:preprotein translocase subunit YajC
MNIQLKEKDEVITSKGYLGSVTKINDKSIWFGEKRYALESVLKDI